MQTIVAGANSKSPKPKEQVYSKTYLLADSIKLFALLPKNTYTEAFLNIT